jgi:beta-galactosidase
MDDDAPLWLDTKGLSKGQVFVNDQNAGRFFTATGDGKAVGPQTRLYLPGPWLKTGTNELVIFDEHGFDPSRVRLEHGKQGPLD